MDPFINPSITGISGPPRYRIIPLQNFCLGFSNESAVAKRTPEVRKKKALAATAAWVKPL